VETLDGSVIIPISRVSFGFAAGGSEFETIKGKAKEKDKERNMEAMEPGKLPFGGGSGAGITIHPVAFLVVGKEQTKLLPIESNILVDRILDSAPQIIDKIQSLISGGTQTPKSEVH
jgi:sporulation protein YtfJ